MITGESREQVDQMWYTSRAGEVSNRSEVMEQIASRNGAPTDAPSPNRVFGLDLLRAVAISLVLTSHYGIILPAWLGYRPRYPIAILGMLGVDLFFTLSGFLIGRLLIDVITIAPTFANLRIFLIRRWMRTLPIYVVWLCVCLILFGPPDHPVRYFISYLTFTQNLAWPMPVSNWFGASWSLAVEEWFYLLFSICAVAVTVIRRTRNSIMIPLAVCLVLPALLRWQVPDSANWDNNIQKIVVLRLDSISYGVGLAWLRFGYPRLFGSPRTCSVVGVGIVAAVWMAMASGELVLPEHAFRTFAFNILDLGFAMCIIGAAALTAQRGWSAWIVRKISDISYGLYLMHLPILLAGYRWLVHGYAITAVGTIAIPIVLALLSWRFFEFPLLKLRPRQTFRLASFKGAHAD